MNVSIPPGNRVARCAAAIAFAATLTVTGCGGDDGALSSAVTTTNAPDRDATSSSAPSAAPPASTSTTTAPREDIDACELLTQERADAVLGQSLQTGVRAGPPDDQSCTYTAPPEGSVAQIELFVGPGAKKFLDVDKDLEHELTPVQGIGDEAEIEEGAIFFRVGTTWAAIRIVTLDDWAAFQPNVEALAREIAAEM